MNTIDHLIALADAFGKATGRSEARVSTMVLSGGHRLMQIRSGESDIGSNRVTRAVQWFSDNWPSDAAWPDGIDRPARSDAEVAE